MLKKKKNYFNTKTQSHSFHNYVIHLKKYGLFLYTNIVFITKYSITQLYTVQDTTKFTDFGYLQKVRSAYQSAGCNHCKLIE